MTVRPSTHPNAEHGLALAVIASSSAPLLLLDGDLSIVAASNSFYRSFQIDPAGAMGRHLSDSALANGMWPSSVRF